MVVLASLAGCAPARGELVESGFSDSNADVARVVEENDASMAMVDQSDADDPMNREGPSSTPQQQAELFAFKAPELYTGAMVSGVELLDDAPLLMSFVVPACPVCVTEGPKLAAAAQLSPEVNFVVVHSFGTVNEFLTYVNTAELAAAENIVHVVDIDGTLWNRFGVTSQPSSILVDGQGAVTSSTGALGDDGLLRAVEAIS